MSNLIYDKEIQALTIQISKNPVHISKEYGECIVDYDKNGDVVAVEVLNFNVELLQ